MKIEGQIQWTDYLEAQLLHLRPAKWLRIVLYCIFGLIGCSLVILLVSSGGDWYLTIEYLIPILFVLALFLLFRYVLLPGRVRHIYGQQKELAEPFEYEITDAGLTVANKYGHSIRPWGNFAKWKENKNLLLLYHSDVLFTMIPRRFCTDEQITAIHSHLLENKIPEASRSFRGCLIALLLYIVLMIIMVAILYLTFRTSY